MHVRKWGERLVVDLPDELVERLGLKDGDEVAVSSSEDATIRIRRDESRARAVADLRARATPLPSDYRFDRNEVHER